MTRRLGTWPTLVLGALAVSALPTGLQAMTVKAFLAKAEALKTKGGAAASSQDAASLRSEIRAAADSYRADIESAKAAGTKPGSCPPPKGQAKIDTATLASAFRHIPAGERGLSVRAAFYDFMEKRYPCH